MAFPRRLIWLLALALPIELLERFAWYGSRSVLAVWLRNGAGFDPETATDIVHSATALVFGLPIVGALLAVAIGPRFVLPIASVIAAAGYGLLAVCAATVLSPSDDADLAIRATLTLLAVGSAMFKPCLVAALAEGFEDPQESVRNAAFMAWYLAINAASFIATLVAPVIVQRSGVSEGAAVVFAGAAVMTMLVAVLSLLLALGWRFDRAGVTAPRPPHPDAWWRALLGAFLLAMVSLPLWLLVEMSTVATMRAGGSRFGQLMALNPAYVCATTLPAVAALAALAWFGIRVRGLLLVGAGLAVGASAVLPQIVSPSSAQALAAAIIMLAVGEALASPMLYARAVAGHHWRLKALIVTGLLATITITNVLTGPLARLSQTEFGSRAVLSVLAGGTFLLGAVLAILHGPLSRFFWPEPESGAIQDRAAHVSLT